MVATLTLRHRPDGRARAPGLLARHRRRRVAGPRGRPVPGRPRGRRRLRAPLRGARHRAGTTSPTSSSPRSRRTSPRRCASVLTVEGSVGVAPRSRRHRAGPGPRAARRARRASSTEHRGRPRLTSPTLLGGPVLEVAPAAARRGAPARRGRGPADRGRGVRRRRRPRLARLPRPDPAQRGDVRPARPPLRLLHLRDAPLLQRRRRTGGHAPARCCSGRARSSTASTSPARGGRGATRPRPRARARPGCARRSPSTATTTAPTSPPGRSPWSSGSPSTGVRDRARGWGCAVPPTGPGGSGSRGSRASRTLPAGDAAAARPWRDPDLRGLPGRC